MAGALKRPMLVVLVLTAMTLGVQSGTSATPARADFCVGGTPWVCFYAEEVISPFQKRWFQAATTLRNWFYNAAWDYYGGSVYKCAGVKRQSDGVINYIACGYGVSGNNIGSSWRPGWVFVEQNANGPRKIGAEAKH